MDSVGGLGSAAEATCGTSTHYDRITASWLLLLGSNLHYGYFLSPTESLSMATTRLTTVMATRAHLAPGLEVLDVGCGVGYPAIFLAENYGCMVTGISTSVAGVEMARETAQRSKSLGNVQFVARDGMANGFPDCSFDCVWVMESSHLMFRKERLLSESARVLRPGGRVILCDIILRSVIPMPDLIRNLGTFRMLDAVFGKAKME